ncbi:MAG: 3(2),5-bisphosphate nucleotidase [Paucimonas sp.]|nr:3(2),5-bisphosphate nucleotidase [Paucimonas sp.]
MNQELESPAPHFFRLAPLVELVDAAGSVIMDVYRSANQQVQAKADNSPVTAADLGANAVICEGLARLWPQIPVLTEEGRNPFAPGDMPSLYWAVDPLDGTKEFLKRNGEFTVNVALVEQGRPVLGVVSAPALGLLYQGLVGHIARRRTDDGWDRIAASGPPAPGAMIRVASSRSHPSPLLAGWLQRFGQVAQRPVGSSLKFCLLAQGEADVYPRFGPTCIWDTAAGHAVLAAAGGCVTTMDGQSLAYSRPGSVLNPDFVAWGQPLPP